MGYRIDYGVRTKDSRRVYPGKTVLLSLLFFGLFLAGVYRYWPEGTAVLHRLISADSWKLTANALETMAEQLRDGQPLTHAVTAFCREIVHYGLEYAA